MCSTLFSYFVFFLPPNSQSSGSLGFRAVFVFPASSLERDSFVSGDDAQMTNSIRSSQRERKAVQLRATSTTTDYIQRRLLLEIRLLGYNPRNKPFL